MRWGITAFLALFISVQSYSQQTYPYQEPDRSLNQGFELYHKDLFNHAIIPWGQLNPKPNSFRQDQIDYLRSVSRLKLLRQNSIPELEFFLEEHPNFSGRSNANFLMGLESFRQKNYGSVPKYFSKVVPSDLSGEERDEFRFKYGYSLLMEKNAQEASQYFNALKGKSDGYGPASAYYSGYIAYSQKDYDGAIRDLKMATGDAAFAKVTPELLASIYYKKGDFDELLKYAQDSRSKSKSAKQVKNLNLLVGDAYFQKEDYQKAWTYFEEAAPKNPASISPELAYRYGRSSFETGQYKEAEKYLKYAVTKSKNDTLSQFCSYYAANSYLKLDDPASAVIFFEKAAEYGVDKNLSENAFYHKGLIRFNTGFFSQSIPVFKSYLEEFPNGRFKTETSSMLGEAFLNTNQHLQGIKHIEEVGFQNSSLKNAYQRLCYIYGSEKFNDKVFDSALVYFEKSRRYPIDKELEMESSFWAGEALSIKKKWPDAVNEYARVFRLDPSGKSKFYLSSRYGIGYAYFNQQLYARAEPHFKAFIDGKNSSKPDAYYQDAMVRLGDSYFTQKKYAQAADTYQQIDTKRFKNRDYALYRLGQISWIQNDAPISKEYFKQLIEDYPRSPLRDNARFEWASVDFEKGNYQAAVSGFSALILAYPKSSFIPHGLFRRGLAYANLQSYDLAIVDYRTFLRRFPRDRKSEEVLSSLNEALDFAGRLDEFESDKIAFQKANPESKALETIEFENGKDAYLAGDYSKAAPLLEKFLKDYPSSVFSLEASYYLAYSYDEAENYSSSSEFYRKVLSYGSSEYLKSSTVRMAEISYSTKNYKDAITFFREWIALGTNQEEQTKASEGMMVSYYQLEKYDSALVIGEALTKVEAPFGSKNLALLTVGKCHLEMGRLDQAKGSFEATINAGTDEYAAEAKFLIAKIQNMLAEFRESTETCLELVTNYGSYTKWVDESFFLVSENFLALDDLFQARSTLESMIQNASDSSVVRRAKEKLVKVEEREKALEDLESFEDTIISDSIE